MKNIGGLTNVCSHEIQEGLPNKVKTEFLFLLENAFSSNAQFVWRTKYFKVGW